MLQALSVLRGLPSQVLSVLQAQVLRGLPSLESPYSPSGVRPGRGMGRTESAHDQGHRGYLTLGPASPLLGSRALGFGGAGRCSGASGRGLLGPE